jgi:hypothetical protein
MIFAINVVQSYFHKKTSPVIIFAMKYKNNGEGFGE